MPSRLATLSRLGGLYGRSARTTVAAQLMTEEQEAVAEGWLGYTPSVEPSIVGYGGMASGSFGLVPRGEHLVHELGWSRVDPTRLPLGDTGAGAAALAAGAANVQAINHLGLFQRSPFAGNEITAVTRDMGGAQASHVFRLPDTVIWAIVPPRGGYPVGASLPTATSITLGNYDFVDDATLSIGVPTGSPYALAAGRGAVAQPTYFFVNSNNLVGMYPCFRAGVQLEYDYPIEAIGAILSFRAASVEAFDGRICYFNIGYSAGNFPNRMWFSVIGDGTNINPASVGAGFIDADEMPGVGRRILRLGDMLAGYFSSGIVLYRKHQPPLAPFQIQYLTQQIGAISMRSVCQLDRDRHFVIADEGWFVVDSTGSIVELGRLQTRNGALVRKWMDEFFANLNRQRAELVNVSFNPIQRLVRIAFPSRNNDTTADTVWYYEVDSDRVWPAYDYADQYAVSQLVAPSTVAVALRWIDMTTTWVATPGTWLSYAARLGFSVSFHGTPDGRVLVQDESKGNLRQKNDGTDLVPQYAYVSHRDPLGAPQMFKSGRRLEVEYENVGGGDATLTVDVDGTLISGVRSMQEAGGGLSGVAYLAVSTPGGTHHGFRVVGSTPVSIKRVRYSYVPMLGTRKHYGVI